MAHRRPVTPRPVVHLAPDAARIRATLATLGELVAQGRYREVLELERSARNVLVIAQGCECAACGQSAAALEVLRLYHFRARLAVPALEDPRRVPSGH